MKLKNRDGNWMIRGRTMSGSGFCSTMLVRREIGLWNYRNRVDWDAMCGLFCWNDYEVFKCDMCIPFPLYV